MTRVSIKREIYLYLFGIVISLTAIYALMVRHSYYTGINESAKYSFLYEIKAAEKEYLDTGILPQSRSGTLQIYLTIDQIPVKYLDIFDWSNFFNDAIYEYYSPATQTANGQYFYAASHYISEAETTLYIVSEYDESIYLSLIEDNPPESVNQFNTAFILIGSLLLFVFIIIRFLIYRLTKPILTLSEWSETLDLGNTDKLKHFRYREVDLLANQLIASVQNERNAIEREEFFLRAASHELRTPVAIVSASSEMLERISESIPRSGQRAISRIQRSVVTMQALITTLLWMSRNRQNELKTSDTELRQMIKDTIESHQYLIESKDVSIEINASSELLPIQTPTELVQIVLTNLVRNAFQHSTNGTITINITSQSVSVTNPIEPSDTERSTSNETSFGIGLILIEKVCENQGWNFIHKQQGNTYSSLVELQPINYNPHQSQ